MIQPALHTIICLILLACNSHAREAPLSSFPQPSNAGPEARRGYNRKYIVELSEESSLADLVHNAAVRNAVYYQEFDCGDVFQGLVVENVNENIDSLAQLPGVANVWPDKTLSLPKPKDPIQRAFKDLPRNYSVHQWTGVDILHKAGLRGKGARVAVVDTGIDYRHSALGGCFGPRCKVAGGYDLVGSGWDALFERTHPKKLDSDPIDPMGHGTHVAGIIAGENEWFTGVAPGAEIFAYKVFSDLQEHPETTEEVLIQAFCDAYSAGSDVITASINRPEGFVDGPWALVASRIVERGVFVSIAAGNEGEKGPFYSGTGSNGNNVLSIAAVNVTNDLSLGTADISTQPAAAFFTSWGPTNELILKPDIGAPGFDIVSTYLDQAFHMDSGSSMAAPYIAGIAALYIAHHGGRELHGRDFAKKLANKIIASGRNVAWSTGEPRFNQTAPVFQVGTGLVDASKVMFYDTEFLFEPFSLQDTETFQRDWSAQVSNKGNHTVNYTLKVEHLPGLEIYDGTSAIKMLSKLKPSRIKPEIDFPQRLTLGPQQSSNIKFHFELPDHVDDDMLPLYGGKIWIQGDNGEKQCIPYGGAAYDTEKAFDTMFDGKPVIDGWRDGATWSFNISKRRSDFADFTGRLAFACEHFRWDIFESGWSELEWSFPLHAGVDGYVGAATSVRDSDKLIWLDPSLVDINDTISFPLMRLGRGYQRFWWLGKLANGTMIAPGNYTMRIAALRPFGNPKFSDHWDIMDMGRNDVQILSQNGTHSPIKQVIKL